MEGGDIYRRSLKDKNMTDLKKSSLSIYADKGRSHPVLWYVDLVSVLLYTRFSYFLNRSCTVSISPIGPHLRPLLCKI